MGRLKLFITAVTFCLLVSSTAPAQDILDPSTLHVGNPPNAGDPNQITGNTLAVVQNSGSVGALGIGGTPNEFYLILGLPNGATLSSSPVTSVIGSDGVAGSTSLLSSVGSPSVSL